MSDTITINVIQESPAIINVNDTGENIYLNPLTLNQGIINHSVTHQSGGSDELLHNLLGGLNGGQLGQYYHLTSGQYFNLTTGDVVRPSETGNFITTSQTGNFYPSYNPSGFITGISNIVYTTGNQDISGLKDFQTRPTVTDIPVLLSGEPVDLIHLYGKNDQGQAIYKGQPVYINGANGANPLIKLAANTQESTSSKTIGLMAQDLAINEFGYIITEGILEGFNTSAGQAGDPMWLGTNGDIIYGTGSKPYGNNHLVYLGIVLRSNINNGRAYIKVQNGFEVHELHKVYATNAQTKDTLLYDSGSGAWFARQINTGDVSGLSQFISSSQSGLINQIDADARYVNITGNENISGLKNFYFRPTVSGSGVLLIGESLSISVAESISGYLQGQITNLSNQTGDYYLISSSTNFGLAGGENNFGLFGLSNDFGRQSIINSFGDTSVSNFFGEASYENNFGALSTNYFGQESINYFGQRIFSSTLNSFGQNADNTYYSGSGIGLFNFDTRPKVNGIPVLLSGEVNNTGYLTGYVQKSETGNFITANQTGAFYPISNPSGFITGVNLSNYATIAYTTGISGFLQGQITTLNNQTGNYILNSQTGVFYPRSNPSGFITGVNLSSYATIPYVTGISGNLQNQIDSQSNNDSFIIGISVFI